MERRYKEAMGSHVTDLGELYMETTKLTNAFADGEASLLMTRQRLQEPVVALRETNRAIEAIDMDTVPERWKDKHTAFAFAAWECTKGADLMLTGMDEDYQSKMQEGYDLLQKCGADYRTAADIEVK